MADEDRVPQLGENVFIPVGEGDEQEEFETLLITEVGEFDDDLGLWNVTCGDRDLQVYWSEDDEGWVPEEA